jgi:hypothetical protein
VADIRLALHAYLSEDAHSGWAEFAEDNGVSITGLAESLGLLLRSEIDKAGTATDVRQEWVLAARRVDVQRRRRGKI